MAVRAKFFVCGRIVITKGEKVLMGKEISPEDANWFMWETPGGGLQPGETLEECLAREALEEIGIGIRILNETPRFRSSADIVPTRYDPGNHWLMVYCRCEPQGEPDLSRASDAEFAELRFVSQRDFNNLVREGGMSPAEQRFFPGVMVDLGLWK
jgi:8-oxo-dGTP pyrophosphatase MutT (NUDIX family)